MTPKDHIEDIKSRYLNADREFVLPSLNRSIDRIEKAFPRYGSFLMEFIQNADDGSSTSLIIEIIEGAIRVFNNGKPFSKEDVNSICKVGLSSKTPKDYIGYLGVGFKSVFLISDSVEIYSGDYKFMFNKSHSPDPELTPWQVIPLWIEDYPVILPSGYTTAFNISVKEKGYLEKMIEETKPEYISNRMLLFLRNLRDIKIKNDLAAIERIIKKSLHTKTDEYEIYLIQEHFNGELKAQEHWLVFRTICDAPPHVQKDPMTKEWERSEVDKREVVVAFRLDEKEKMTIEKKGTAHIGVFSFLPLKEVPSGLNFLIQADFLTTPGRGELARECVWNEWLAKEIYKLIIKKCIPVFIKDDRWRMDFLEVLYSQEGGHELFEKNIKKPLREYLETQPCLIAEDGSVIKTVEALIVCPHIKEIISDDDLKKLFPDKKVLIPGFKVPLDIERKVKKGPTYSASSGVDSEMQRLLKLKSEQKDINFFKKFYKSLSHYEESTLGRSPLRSQVILLTDTWELVDAKTACIKPHTLSIPVEVKENFKIIHPELSSDTTILQFLKALGVEELTAEHIQNILNTKEIPTIGKNWSTLSDIEKIEKIRLCKDLWKNNQIDIRVLSFLTLKTKSGKWLKPAEIIFSKDYRPDHRIEILMKKGLLDLPIEYLSDEFIKGKGDEEISEWYNFFKELGVDKALQDRNFRKNIISRIGILTALRFEKSKGREARELGRSEETGGYDIPSLEEPDEGFGLIQSQERYIEVKSSGKANPDIFLTTRQFSTLQEKRENYFVYVIKDALRYPTLCVTRGDRLLKITEIKTIIPFSRWWSEAKDEEFQPDS